MRWLRRHRVWLALLVPAFVLALVGNSSRIHLFWWTYGLHEPTRTTLGQPAHFDEDFHDFEGAGHRSLTATVIDVTPGSAALTPTGEPLYEEAPPGTQWIRVTVRVETDPRTVLNGCHLSVVDTDGREARFRATPVGTRGGLGVSPCVPADRPGPESSGSTAQAAVVKTPRPERYEVTSYVLAAPGFRPAEVRLWWGAPRYIAVDVGEAR